MNLQPSRVGRHFPPYVNHTAHSGDTVTIQDQSVTKITEVSDQLVPLDQRKKGVRDGCANPQAASLLPMPALGAVLGVGDIPLRSRLVPSPVPSLLVFSRACLHFTWLLPPGLTVLP